jgi:hypothetical protein
MYEAMPLSHKPYLHFQIGLSKLRVDPSILKLRYALSRTECANNYCAQWNATSPYTVSNYITNCNKISNSDNAKEHIISS